MPIFARYVRSRQPSRGLAAVVSASKDGAIVETVLETDLVARLRPTVSLVQRRQAWGLTRQGQTVATMSIDQVSANGNHWTELEIELAASLPDREVEHLVAELRDELERSPQISISTETKPERASRRSV